MRAPPRRPSWWPRRDRPHGPNLLTHLNAGETVVVPDGVYTAAALRNYRPHTRQTIRPETQFGAAIDLSTSNFTLEECANLALVGFRFLNGVVRLNGCENVTLAYNTFSYPGWLWWRRYLALRRWEDPYGPEHDRCQHPAGYIPAADGHHRDAIPHLTRGMVGAYPTPLRLHPSGLRPNVNITIAGNDFRDCGDDGCVIFRTDGLTYQGNRAWHLGGVDPGHGFGTSGDWWHSDSIQLADTINDATISDSWLGGKVQIGAPNGKTISRLRMERLWVTNSPQKGMLVTVNRTGRILASTMRDVRAFANGHGDPKHDKPWVDQHLPSTPTTRVYPDRFDLPGVLELDRGPVDTTTPAGCSSIRGIRVHPDNPANRWRADHPYESWL